MIYSILGFGFFFFFLRIRGFSSSVVCWACHGLDLGLAVGLILGLPSVALLCYNFFFFQILVEIFFFWVLFFFFLLESRTNIYIYIFNLKGFLILIKGVPIFF